MRLLHPSQRLDTVSVPCHWVNQAMAATIKQKLNDPALLAPALGDTVSWCQSANTSSIFWASKTRIAQ